MRTLYFCLIISILCSSSISAQITKGTVTIGGSLSYGTEKTENIPDSKIKYIGIAPAFGIAIKENLVAGIDLEYMTIDGADQRIGTNDAKGAGVFLRKYWNIGKRFYAFGQIRAGVRWTEISSNIGLRMNTEEFNTNITLKPGLAFSLSKKVQLETVLLPLFTAQYRKTERSTVDWYSIKTGSTKKGFEVNTSLANNTSLAIGIRILLGK